MFFAAAAAAAAGALAATDDADVTATAGTHAPRQPAPRKRAHGHTGSRGGDATPAAPPTTCIREGFCAVSIVWYFRLRRDTTSWGGGSQWVVPEQFRWGLLGVSDG